MKIRRRGKEWRISLTKPIMELEALKRVSGILQTLVRRPAPKFIPPVSMGKLPAGKTYAKSFPIQSTA